MKIHDIIIGDLGRKGTLRYFEAYSTAEKELLEQEVESEEFYDEYRMIRYTIVGALRDIKHEILPGTLEEIEDSVLVGVEGGPDPVDILPDVVRIAVPYIANALDLEARIIRLIIPCNTMFTVATRLRDIFSDGANLKLFSSNRQMLTDEIEELAERIKPGSIQVPAVAEEVIGYLNNRGIENVMVAASDAANDAYRRVIEKNFDHLEFSTWLPPGVSCFSDLLQMAINSEPIPMKENFDPKLDAIVSACTDIPIPGTYDSTEIFAKRLVADAYGRLDLA